MWYRRPGGRDRAQVSAWPDPARARAGTSPGCQPARPSDVRGARRGAALGAISRVSRRHEVVTGGLRAEKVAREPGGQARPAPHQYRAMRGHARPLRTFGTLVQEHGCGTWLFHNSSAL